MLDGAIVVPVMQMLYSFLYEMAAVLWGLQRAVLLTGYVVMAITDWLVNQAFTPLLSSLGAQTEVFLGPVFTIALLVLAGTYLMGVFLRIRVVEFKSAVVWFLVALLLFQGGPQLYQGVEEMRRGIAGAFYEEGLNLLGEGGGALAALDQVGSGAEADIPAPTNQLGAFLPSDQYVDGLDVAMSYLGADAYDVIAPSNPPHPIERLPWSYIAPDGYFDFATSGAFFGDLSREAREASLARAIQGIARLFMGGFISVFGVLEQIIHLALAMAMGLAFASAFIAILFAFFKHTEVLVWSVLNLVIELFVQSVMMSLFLSLIISFVLVGAVTGNAVVTLGTVLVGLVLVFILLLAAFKAIWNGINRLFGAMGQITGGTMMSPGGVAAGAAGMATGAALGAAGGAMALATGSNLTQAAGIALGNNPTLSRAAYMTSMLPGLRETRIGQFAGEFTEGAIARSALGPIVGGVVVPPRRADAQRAAASDPAEAVSDYYHPRSEKVRETRMERAFGAAAPQMAHVMDAHSEDELLEIVAAVKAVRAANSTLPASSPAFQSAVAQRLPDETSRAFSAEDLRLVITASGALPAERERFGREAAHEPPAAERAVRDYYAAPDRATAYTGLQNAVGSTAAPEVARVLDAHTEDDIAEVAAAIRSLQTTQPNLNPNSDEFLRALKTQLVGATSAPLSPETLQTLTRGLTADPGQQVIDLPSLAQAIGAAVGGYRQINGAAPLSFEQAASTVAQSAGLPPNQTHPFGSHTAAVGHFVSQAVALNLTPQQAAQVVVDVRQGGHLPDGLWNALRSNPANRGSSPDELNGALRALEAAARALPRGVVTGGVQPASFSVAQPTAIRPEIQPGAVITALEMEGDV
jgi:hypothetical protein